VIAGDQFNDIWKSTRCQLGIECASSGIEIERVGLAHDDEHTVAQYGGKCAPFTADAVGNVVLAPVLSNSGVDAAGGSVPQSNRQTVVSARAE